MCRLRLPIAVSVKNCLSFRSGWYSSLVNLCRQYCVDGSSRYSDGCRVKPFVSITSNIKIGKCFHANLYSYVEHDCVIGDFVTFAPGVKCNGNIHIQDHAYIGAGAMIKQGTPDQPLIIGAGAVVGMGAVVTKVCLHTQQWWEILPVL